MTFWFSVASFMCAASLTAVVAYAVRCFDEWSRSDYERDILKEVNGDA